MTRFFLTTALLLMIVGCSARPRPVLHVPTEVKVPVAVPCKPAEVTQRDRKFPLMKPSDDPWDKLKTLITDHLRVGAENTELRAANTGCKP